MIPSVLQKIADSVTQRLNGRKAETSLAALTQLAEKSRRPNHFASAFSNVKTKILAEVKFKSPALGELKSGNAKRAVELAGQYLEGGAVAISVLTEQDHFHGHPDYLKQVRLAYPHAKLLMKDFVVDEYQILEARVLGADAVLLIVSLLGQARTRELAQFARLNHLSTLVEVHDASEFEFALSLECDLVGVNNRDLKTLSVTLQTSLDLASHIPKGRIILSESGIGSREDITCLENAGYGGFLVGSALMKSSDPVLALKKLRGIPG
jgi:indole-3-glycerol phosphate synthase